MRGVIVSYSQPIRLSDLTLNLHRVTRNSVNRRLLCWTFPKVAILGADQKERGLREENPTDFKVRAALYSIINSTTWKVLLNSFHLNGHTFWLNRTTIIYSRKINANITFPFLGISAVQLLASNRRENPVQLTRRNKPRLKTEKTVGRKPSIVTYRGLLLVESCWWS